jgi:hypothetical protein
MSEIYCQDNSMNEMTIDFVFIFSYDNPRSKQGGLIPAGEKLCGVLCKNRSCLNRWWGNNNILLLFPGNIYIHIY